MISVIFLKLKCPSFGNISSPRENLTCIVVAVDAQCVCVCVRARVWGVASSTLRVVSLRVGLLIILWVIYATSKSWIGYLKNYAVLSYIMFGPHACIGGPLGHSPSCGYQRRAHSLARKGFQFPPTMRGIWPKGGFILACVWCGSWWDSILKLEHVRTHPPTGLKWGGYASWCSVFPVCEACATSKLCIGFSNIT